MSCVGFLTSKVEQSRGRGVATQRTPWIRSLINFQRPAPWSEPVSTTGGTRYRLNLTHEDTVATDVGGRCKAHPDAFPLLAELLHLSIASLSNFAAVPHTGIDPAPQVHPSSPLAGPSRIHLKPAHLTASTPARNNSGCCTAAGSAQQRKEAAPEGPGRNEGPGIPAPEGSATAHSSDYGVIKLAMAGILRARWQRSNTGVTFVSARHLKLDWRAG
ncbi:hypothetical protein DFH08DRAFT_812648 [Mycena albidolilacea]|uniref:Uncharacterized protein n=1 Tax=Mycena albidolilacea TaxID=1033008 RepID=A0AAD6ZUW0_9AGAR|nr:hypothetical protein DFH08DRAFT_812648 [Mycena albidolilacea]